MINKIKNLNKQLRYARSLFKSKYFTNTQLLIAEHKIKTGRLSRTKIINIIASSLGKETSYLEIGVRNPDDNFNKIDTKIKCSVDPGVEYQLNPVDYPITSDEFFELYKQNKENRKFDIIFIDGLHESRQVYRDIINSIDILTPRGIIILHDCNPLTEFHAREQMNYIWTPSGGQWNGTTWKAFVKFRCENKNEGLISICVDTDHGVGIIAGHESIFSELYSPPQKTPLFFDYSELEENRTEFLGLVSIDKFLNIFKKNP